MTIHSWSGIGIRSKLDRYDLDKITTTEYLSKRIHAAKVLIIDEISMLSSDMLDMIDLVCREVRQNDDSFGGIQIVLVGDFFQLPPIIKQEQPSRQHSLLDNSEVRLPNIFAYESGAWERARQIICYLTEQHRQDDTEFLDVLSAIRNGSVGDDHLRTINSRAIDQSDMPENITKLFSHNFNVDSVNSAELAKLEEESRVFSMTSDGTESLVTALKKGCLSPERLELKVGAVVMCTKNNQKEHYVNGTLGVVIGFDEYSGYPRIKDQNGNDLTISPMDWVVEEGGKIRAEITQVPLRLAWAMTVHKSQGMSLDACVMDLSQAFEYGQGYVALSRVRRLSGLYLLGLNDHALQVNPDVLEQDIVFKSNSDEAVKAFAHLTKDKIKKMHKNFVSACGGKIKK